MAKENLQEQNESLESQIRAKKAELKGLETTIKERDSRKKELWADLRNRSRLIKNKKAEKNKLNEQVRDLRSKLNKLEPSIKTLSAEKTSLEPQVQKLKESHVSLTEKISGIKNTISESEKKITALNSNIERLSEQKLALQNEVQTWQQKSELYTNDIDGISEAHKISKRYYLGGAIISGVLLFFTIGLIMHRVWFPKPMNWLEDSIFANDHTLAFYLLILLRASTIAVLIIITYIFLNLTKNFVSQFIRTVGKMNSIRSLLFLLEKIQVSESELAELSEDAQLTLEKDALNKQVSILQDNLPVITSQSQNSFDKFEKFSLADLTKGVTEKGKE